MNSSPRHARAASLAAACVAALTAASLDVSAQELGRRLPAASLRAHELAGERVVTLAGGCF